MLVAHDEMFQVKIIGDGIAKVEDHKNRVVYRPDAILPDDNVDAWVVEGALKVVNTAHGIRTTIEIRLPDQERLAELWTVIVENLTERPRALNSAGRRWAAARV